MNATKDQFRCTRCGGPYLRWRVVRDQEAVILWVGRACYCSCLRRVELFGDELDSLIHELMLARSSRRVDSSSVESSAKGAAA